MKKIVKATLAALCCASMGLVTAGLASCGEEGTKKFNVTYAGEGVVATQPLVVEKDGLVVKPEDPTREHYIFDGWYNGDTKWDFDVNKVTEDVTLTAKWTAIEYTVIFNDYEGNEYQKVTYTADNVSTFKAPEVPTAPDYRENGRWSKTPEEYLTFSTSPITVIPVYDYVKYSVTFKDGETTVGDVKMVNGGFNVEKPADLSKDYYIFDGWYNGDTKWNFVNDVVETDGLVLTAKWTALEYTVIFNDYEGNEYQTLTYTVENKDDFAFPQFPTLPEGCTNPSWNKAMAECLVFSTEPIVVTAVCERAPVKVYFANTALEIPAEEVIWGEKVDAPATPEMDGYVFNGWTLNGEAFDFENTAIKSDITLVASWLALSDILSKSEMSAEEVKENSVCDPNYVSKNQIEDNANGQVGGWYQDTDYFNDNVIGKAENVYDKWFQFGITVDGGAGTSDTGIERVITLPKLNYSLYTKVEFAYKVSGNPTVIVYGNSVPYGKKDGSSSNSNKVAIITKEADGVYIEFREVNDGPSGSQGKYKLPDAVASGQEGLTFTFQVKGWVGFQVSEFHLWDNQLDYQAKMAEALAKLPESVEGLTYSAEERALAAEYLSYAEYMTDYEKSLPEPEVITALKTAVVTLNVNGVTTEWKCEIGKIWAIPDSVEAPEGYVFKGWMKDGVLFDVNTPADGNITLTAAWLKIAETEEKSVILTAEEVQAQTVMVQDAPYLGCDGIKTNPTWAFDSDYLVNWAGTPDQLFEKAVQYSTDAKEFTHVLYLPKINYTQYSKIDFAIQSDGAISDIIIGGTAVEYKPNYVISIRTDENGTFAYVYEMNVGAQNPDPIAISTAVATGEEALSISFKSNGYMWIKISQFHGPSNVIDYTAKMAEVLAKLPTSVDGLTYSEAEKALAASYLSYAEYMTDYEKSVYEEPAVINALKG